MSACPGKSLAPRKRGVDAGFPKGLPSRKRGTCATPKTRRGFSLLEALVALTVVLAFAGALGPLLLQARRIMAGADDRVAAQILLRALLADPLDPARLNGFVREGESQGLQWRVATEPTTLAAVLPRGVPRLAAADPTPSWVAYRVIARVAWGHGQSVSAETLRLGKAAP